MDQLKRLRVERGLSQARLAARAELDPSTVNQIERGAREASPATLRKLADALDVSLIELLEADSPKAQAPPPPEDSERGDIDQQLIRELEDVRDKVEDEEIARRVGLAVALVKQRVEQAKQRNRERVTSE